MDLLELLATTMLGAGQIKSNHDLEKIWILNKNYSLV